MSEEELEKLKKIAETDEAIENLKAKASLKSLKQFLEEKNQIIEIYVPFPVDGRFKVKRPSVKDFLLVSDKEGEEYDREVLYLLMHGADETVTREMIGQLSDEEVTVFLGAVNFLSVKKP